MDGRRFDHVVRSWMHPASRRQAMRAAAGGALGALATLAGVKVGRAACLKNQKDCKRDNQCCSGKCRRGRCREAAFQSNCTVERVFCKGGAENFNGCAGNPNCTCVRSLSGAVMCAEVLPCWPCASNADCKPVVGPNAVCGRPVGAGCANTCSEVGGTFCARPCDPND